MIIYAVVLPIAFHQPEIESLWVRETDAEARRDELNGDDDYYRVDEMELHE